MSRRRLSLALLPAGGRLVDLRQLTIVAAPDFGPGNSNKGRKTRAPGVTRLGRLPTGPVQ